MSTAILPLTTKSIIVEEEIKTIMDSYDFNAIRLSRVPCGWHDDEKNKPFFFNIFSSRRAITKGFFNNKTISLGEELKNFWSENRKILEDLEVKIIFGTHVFNYVGKDDPDRTDNYVSFRWCFHSKWKTDSPVNARYIDDVGGLFFFDEYPFVYFIKYNKYKYFKYLNEQNSQEPKPEEDKKELSSGDLISF
jgi:hypothetical protein